MPDIEARQEELWTSIEPRLDLELSRLPEKYRAVLILCDLEGRTRKEAARQLGVPEGTVAGHLARAREMLAKRLTRNGSAMSGAALATLLTQQAASAAVPTALVIKTAKAVTLVAAGKAAAGLIPGQVLSLAQGVMQAMLLKKLKIGILGLLLAIGIAGVGGVTVRGLVNGTQPDTAKQGTNEAAAPIVDSARADPDQQSPAAAQLKAGPPLFQIEHLSRVMHVTWAPDGNRIATGTWDEKVYIFDAATGIKTQSIQVGNGAGAIAFSPDSKSLAVIEAGPVVGLWDISASKKERQFGGAWCPAAPEHVSFSADGTLIFGLGVGGFYHWSAKGGSGVISVRTLPGFAAMAPDGLVSGWSNPKGFCSLFRYDPNDPNNPSGPTGLEVGDAQCIAFGPGGKLMAVGGDGTQIRLWDLATKKETAKLTGLEKPATKMTFSADGKTLAALADDGISIVVWDLTRKTTRCQVNHDRGEVGLLALSSDGKKLVTTVKDGKVAYVWGTAARLLSRKEPLRDLTAKEMGSLWTTLSDTDYEKTDAAFRNLGAAGDNAIPFLRMQIRAIAVPAADMPRIEKLVAELNAEKFTTREQATKELMTAGELAIVPLQHASWKSRRPRRPAKEPAFSSRSLASRY